jgi:hypothetical protein
MRKSILTIVIAMFGWMAGTAFNPAAARMVMDWCGIGWSRCQTGCTYGQDPLHDPDGSRFNACKKQCDAHHKLCVRREGTVPGIESKQTRVRATVQQPAAGPAIPGNGILDRGPGFSSQGPAATGTPRAPTAPPPVIIR